MVPVKVSAVGLLLVMTWSGAAGASAVGASVEIPEQQCGPLAQHVAGCTAPRTRVLAAPDAHTVQGRQIPAMHATAQSSQAVALGARDAIRLPCDVDSQQVTLAAGILPANIRLEPLLAIVFDRLLASSAMFREQCARIAGAAFVRVSVHVLPSRSPTSGGRARTTLRRFSSGALTAVVEIPVPLTMSEYAELFGHEFEHVLEQMENVDLAALARTDEARRLQDGSYETERAQRAGAAMANESYRTETLPSQPDPASDGRRTMRADERRPVSVHRQGPGQR